MALWCPGPRKGSSGDATAVSAVFVLCTTEGFPFASLKVKNTSQSSALPNTARINIFCFTSRCGLELSKFQINRQCRTQHSSQDLKSCRSSRVQESGFANKKCRTHFLERLNMADKQMALLIFLLWDRLDFFFPQLGY